MGQDVLLKMTGITKTFPGVKALDGVNLTVKAGTIHALMGENGAGKSTLIKVLCGIHKRDGGTIEYLGKVVSYDNIGQSQDAGISVIHQELNMMNDLTVAQNMFIGREFMKNGLIDDKAMEAEAQRQFDKMGVKIDAVVDIFVPDEEIVSRMSGRRVCLKCGATYHTKYNPPKTENVCDACGEALVIRKDDSAEVVNSRLEVYHKETEPLKSYYDAKGLVKTVVGQEKLEDTTALTLKALGI